MVKTYDDGEDVVQCTYTLDTTTRDTNIWKSDSKIFKKRKYDTQNVNDDGRRRPMVHLTCLAFQGTATF